MAETKHPCDFIFQAADDLLANTPALVALVKAEALGQLWKNEEPQPGAPFFLQPYTPGETVTIKNEVATQAIEEMIRAALALAAAREKHVRSTKVMEEMVAGLRAKARAKKGGDLPAVGSFHG
ncbi:hypothetical protein [Methylorubrum extorquens]|uniref:Uncharacterized protein n=1 Tax=Methylorubrum extorquens (strain CM4 / NCIMB 13688) TaxID=440085 RepID=B7KVZ3_METC4|nr:hypothetical protein [Methylorubrum extorquens]ACK82809.1 hypothetical protein Mchl_1946 [Methylorubrum extorquens CM4]